MLCFAAAAIEQGRIMAAVWPKVVVTDDYPLKASHLNLGLTYQASSGLPIALEPASLLQAISARMPALRAAR